MRTEFIVIIVFLALVIVYAVIEIIEHKCVDYIFKEVSKKKGKKLCVISDLHNCTLPKKVTEKIASEKPDCIILAGDIINQKNLDVSHTVKFLFDLSKIAPIYYCYGNHEKKNEFYQPLQWENFKSAVSNLCEFVEDKAALPDDIDLYGVNLSRLMYDNAKQSGRVALTSDELKEFPESVNPDKYNIVVCHTPAYAEYLRTTLKPDLIISAHLHGGHVRLPFIGGILYTIIPRPKYLDGLYREGSTSIYVTRGAGTHFIPVRF